MTGMKTLPMKKFWILLIGTYTFFLTAEKSISQHILVHEINQPEQLVVDAGPDQRGTIGSIHIGLSDPVDGGTPPYIYSWSPAELVDNPSAPYTQPTAPSADGFVLTVTDQMNCSASDTVFIDFPTGLEDEMKEIRIYPNPTGNFLNIGAGVETISGIRVITQTGKALQLPVTYGNQITLDVTSLTRGTYILQFNQSEKTIRRKIIIQ